MLFSDNLEGIIFNRHNMFEVDELIILSGYIGPGPVAKLEELPIKTTVIYGMYGSDGIRCKLHETLTKLNKRLPNTKILYSTTAIHSKCYIWRYKGKVVHALIGSANFSTNGLKVPFKEILAETTLDTFKPLNDYVNKIIDSSIICDLAAAKEQDVEDKKKKINILAENPNVCTMALFNPITGDVPDASGLNWGQSINAHVNPNDAYIAIRSDYIRNYPNLFPKKQKFPHKDNTKGKKTRHNDSIDIIWDDGTTMEGLLEGSYDINNVKYPKQIASFPKKLILGEYIRKRIGIKSGEKVSIEDLKRYGRCTVDVSLLAEGIYYFDFSINK